MFGNPETTPGGRALKFYASVRIDVRKLDTLKHGNEMIGNRTRAKVVKNKVAPPFRQAEFDIIYGEGISKEGCVLDLAVEKEIVKKSGTWYSYKEEKVGQGRDNAKEFLKENKEILNEIEQQIRKIYNLPFTFEAEETQQSKSGKNEAS
jgi:recombination protein RecA